MRYNVYHLFFWSYVSSSFESFHLRCQSFTRNRCNSEGYSELSWRFTASTNPQTGKRGKGREIYQRKGQVLHSLKLTEKAPENGPKRPKRKFIWTNHWFSGAMLVSGSVWSSFKTWVRAQPILERIIFLWIKNSWNLDVFWDVWFGTWTKSTLFFPGLNWGILGGERSPFR